MRSAIIVSALLSLSLLAPGCGVTTDAAPAPGTLTAAAQVLSGMPRCDESLLHPRLSVADAASMPGKTIVYVDGVMACVDDSAYVDQLVSQVESRFSHEPPPAPAVVAEKTDK